MVRGEPGGVLTLAAGLPASARFSIGGFGVSFEGKRPAVIRVLRRRYKAFEARARGLSFRVEEAAGRQLPFRPSVAENYGKLFLRRGDFGASLDLRSGKGFLSAAPNEQCLDAFLRSLISCLLLRSGGLMIHSAGIVKRGRAYVFPGVSGAGKSTLAKLAEGGGFEVISDEINLLRMERGRWRVYGSPFWGEMRAAGRRASWPLGGVLLLKKARGHGLLPCGRAEAARALLRCLVNFERSGEASAAALGSMSGLLRAVSGRLAFSRKDAGFMELI